MPGLVGFIGNYNTDQAQPLLQRMAKALHDDAGFRVDLFSFQGLGLGRVSLKITNPEPQPIWNEDQTICIVMEGEIYDYDQLKQELINQGHHFRVDNDPEFVLHLYEQVGEGFITRLNGAFVVAIWDQHERKLIIANDRFGLHPIYYIQHRSGFLFASGMRSILADSTVPRIVDPVAIAQYLTFDHVLGDRTLLNNIHLLPQASLLIFKEGQLSIYPYWRLTFSQSYQTLRDDEYVDGYLYHLRQAVSRRGSNGLAAGVLLSGGLDSRMILCLLKEGQNNQSLHTFTFGILGSDDVRYALELAQKTNTKHHFYKLQGDFLKYLIEEGVNLTDGMSSSIHLTALATLSEEAQLAKVFYKGFMGDVLLGYMVDRWLLGATDREHIFELHYSVHKNQGQIVFDIFDHDKLFSQKLQQQINGAVIETYRVSLEESGSDLLANQRIYFDLRHRIPRMTLNGVELVRSRGSVLLPYTDNDFVTFVLGLPLGLRINRYISKMAIARACPELAKVPNTETDRPYIPCTRGLFLDANSQLRWRLRSAGMSWVSVPQRHPFTDYNLWMRTDLRDWVEGILLNPTTLERGYFDRDYIQKLVSQHMNGENNASKLGALISLEIWNRLFLD